jgi:hypothetical protein
VVLVEDFESIVNIEVWLKTQGNLRRLNFSLKSNKVTEAVYELVFLVKVEDGALDGAASNGAAAGVNAA